MPDITMCTGVGCPLRARCYRATAIPWTRQSYFATPPVVFVDGGAMCDSFVAPFSELPLCVSCGEIRRPGHDLVCKSS